MNINVEEQLRKKMHAGSSLRSSRFESYSSYEYEEKTYHPAGNLYYAWPAEEPPPGGWEGQ
jgi:hypothetical protein